MKRLNIWGLIVEHNYLCRKEAQKSKNLISKEIRWFILSEKKVYKVPHSNMMNKKQQL